MEETPPVATAPAPYIGLDLSDVPVSSASQEPASASPALDAPPPPTPEQVNFQLQEQFRKLRLPRCPFCHRRPTAVFKPGTEATADLGPGTVEVIPCCSAKVVKENEHSRVKNKGRRKPHRSAFLIRVSKLAQELWDAAKKPERPVQPDVGEGPEYDAKMKIYAAASEEFNKDLFKRSEGASRKAQETLLRSRRVKRKKAAAQQKLSRRRNRR